MRNELEEELGWEVVMAANDRIGKFLGFTPRIEYSVGSEEKDSIVYTPQNCCDWSMHEVEQKNECERWLKEHREKYPKSEFSHPSYIAWRREWYPQFHRDWNALHSALTALKMKGRIIPPITDIETVWKFVSDNCVTDWEEIEKSTEDANKRTVFLVTDSKERELHGCFDSLDKAKKFAAGMAFWIIKPLEVK